MTSFWAWAITIAGMTLAGLIVIGCTFVFDHGITRGWWKDWT